MAQQNCRIIIISGFSKGSTMKIASLLMKQIIVSYMFLLLLSIFGKAFRTFQH